MDKETKKTSRQKRYDKLKASIPEGLPVPAARLRFPIIPKEIEYLDIIDRKTTLKSYKSEIAGMAWREVNEKLYKDGIPAGKYSYAMKFMKNPDIYRGFIKSVNPSGERVDKESVGISSIRQTIEGLKDSLRSKSDNIGIDYIINSMQKSHDAESNVYKLEIASLKEKILELKKEITDLNTELDTAESIINQFKESEGQNKLTETILGILNQLAGPKLNPPKT